jgi:hypothetical protein
MPICNVRYKLAPNATLRNMTAIIVFIQFMQCFYIVEIVDYSRLLAKYESLVI